MIPVTNAAHGAIYPDPGVTPASPAMAPLSNSSKCQWPSFTLIMTTHMVAEVQAEMWVLKRAEEATPLAARAEPPLKEYQPAQTMEPPMTVRGRLWEGKGLFLLRVIMRDTTKPAAPAVVWMVIPPAKSFTP
jgi:hypothetical protein